MKHTLSLSFQTRTLALQVLIVLATMVVSGILVSLMQERQFREAYVDRMIAVAQSVATLPTILDAYETEDPSIIIQPIAEVVRKASNVTYIVVTDDEGIRYSHTNPDRIGEKVSTDPSVPLSGEMYVGTQTGTLGESWRVKLPVFSKQGDIIGSVSVGILEADLRADLASERDVMLLSLMAAGTIGVLGSTWLGYYLRRKTFKLEPEEIASLLETREAMISGIREGIIAIDTDDNISLMNDAAKDLTGIDRDAEVIGKAMDTVLGSGLLRLVRSKSSTEQLVLSDQRLLVARSDIATVDERVVGRLIILRDHTELHQLLNQLEGAQSLAQGLRAQAHEFSNKLHVVSGLLELGHNEEAIAFIERVGSGGAISELLRSEGALNIEIAALILAKRARAQELGIRLILSDDARLGLDAGNADEVELLTDALTVLGNLIDNALDAVKHGGSIWVHLADADAVRITVDDDGPGVPEGLAENIFEIGVTTKSHDSSGRSESRGIGLALVQRLTEKHGGSVAVSGSQHGGARFEVILNYQQQHQSEGVQ